MLIGQYESNLSSGNRIAVPKKLRVGLGENFIIARWYEKSLIAISMDSWTSLITRLLGSDSLFKSASRDTYRFLMGSAYEASLDSQGRFVLPPQLKEFSHIESEVIFLGLGDRVEVWDKKLWIERENYVSQNAPALLEEVYKS